MSIASADSSGGVSGAVSLERRCGWRQPGSVSLSSGAASGGAGGAVSLSAGAGDVGARFCHDGGGQLVGWRCHGGDVSIAAGGGGGGGGGVRVGRCWPGRRRRLSLSSGGSAAAGSGAVSISSADGGRQRCLSPGSGAFGRKHAMTLRTGTASAGGAAGR